MKQTIKIYMEKNDIEKLRAKASQQGINGRGSISHYIIRIAREPIAFLDKDVIKLLSKQNEG